MKIGPREMRLNMRKVSEPGKLVFLPPVTKLGQGNIFRSVCQEFCPQGWGVCMAGGHEWHG